MFFRNFGQFLKNLEAQNLYRRRQVVTGPQGVHVEVDGRRFLNFCSNDYLGLANHPEVVDALKRGAERFGVGSGSAHLINGHCSAHHALEEELADFTGFPRALLFSTGYMANLGVLSALAGRKDRVFEDRLNHASLLDGARLSGARFKRYPHRDLAVLADYLAQDGESAQWVASDGVFSMDGDLADLPGLSALCRSRDAGLLIDDAHGLGVLGPRGGGTLEHFGLDAESVSVLVGTLGKAFGTFGAFAAGRDPLIEFLIQRARPYIYTTALPPALAEATRRSLRLVSAESWRREKLRALIQRFRIAMRGLNLPLMESVTPIQPVPLGESSRALEIAARLRAHGILVMPIRPPTVPPGSARLRVTFSASHEESHVDRLVEALSVVLADA